MSDDTITITKLLYESLCEDSDKLMRLEAAGVDNWCGYDEAMSMEMEDD